MSLNNIDNMRQIIVPLVEGLERMAPEEFDAAMLREGAHAAVDCVNWPNEYPYKPSCSFDVARSRDCLAFRFDVEGADLRATVMHDNGESWKDSCCEVFISPEGGEYYNVETTCIGSVLMACGSGRAGRVKLPPEQVARVIRRSSLPHEPVEVAGGMHRWQLAVLIPFSLIGLDPERLPSSLRGNVYKCGDLTATPHFLSWNPIRTEHPDFHRPECFGEFLLR